MSSRPIVIAHRGASGYLPEHTLAAKSLAYGMGADYIEQDVVATRDGELVVLHDLYLDDVTDVARRFPGRHRPDGRFYVIDFELHELRALEISERRRAGSDEALFAERFPLGNLGFPIATLDEELELVRGLNRSTGRNVGVYPEIKYPCWHLDHGIDLTRLLVAKLGAYGYASERDAVFVQCFDPAALRSVREDLGSSLKLVQLVDDHGDCPELLTREGLAEVAAYAQGLGSHYSQLVTASAGLRRSAFADTARDAGLLLHPYTFRREQLPDYAGTLEELLSFFLFEVKVDGVFCDHPDIAVRVVSRDAVLGK